jgi:hypothetical protein|tara:strand:+ start:1133 stop:1498 length:366 start_codon:yes stop_codon:yes gene_type:complete
MKFEEKHSKELQNAIFILNQIFEIECKSEKLTEANSIDRNLRKLKEFFSNTESPLTIENPIGEEYSETRTDVEASISGDSMDNLFIVDVIKPIIRITLGKKNLIAQKAIVIVESKKGDSDE